MCGLLAYYQQMPLEPKILSNIYSSLQAINHRGPDGEGILLINTDTGEFKDWDITSKVDILSYNMVLGHKRLAIFDLSEAGHQPMIDSINQCLIVFNGEIYNFKELRKELEDLGHSFKSSTDTEVIIKAYKTWGIECLKKFNGMWAFVLFDCITKKLFISRDRFGIKPLNYHVFEDKSWVIVSEEKQLFSFKKFKKEINYTAIKDLMLHQIIGVDDSTFYKGVYQFGKSKYNDEFVKSFSFENQLSYYAVDIQSIKYTGDENKLATDTFNEHFNRAMDYTLRADVPIGLGFSGGVDSSRIVYECYEHFQKPETFSAIFPNRKEDESYFINLVKEDLNLNSNFCYPELEFSDTDFDKLTYHLDAPVPSSSYYAQWCVSRLVNNKKIKVLLVGQGADEVFAGYHHHFYRYLRTLLLNGKISLFKKEIKAYAVLKNISEKKLYNIVKDEIILYLKLKVTRKRDTQSNWYLNNSLAEFLKDELIHYQIPFYLQADDRIGMAWQFESRYPFLDHELVNFGFQCSDELKINKGWQKWIIRNSKKEVPNEIGWRKDKIGYRMPEILSPESDMKIREYVNEKVGVLSSNKFINYSVSVWLKQQLEAY